MVVKVSIKKNDYGMNYVYTIEDVNLTAYTCKLYVWLGSTTLVDGETVSTALSGSDTVCTYTVQSGDFDTVGEWKAELAFTGGTYSERTETFTWEVLPIAE